WIEDVYARASIADYMQIANEQHYEVFTKLIVRVSCLGPSAKYSSCLQQAEILVLESRREKTQLADRMDVLDPPSIPLR
ncbi:uncharacterized protein EDB93DRAFT_1081256, partial [Suillus bovinus]|uniref:uncharacterized protein n=1 Tax=Suillus bovinus TaxID=48563 RepID=UPI001B85FE85